MDVILLNKAFIKLYEIHKTIAIPQNIMKQLQASKILWVQQQELHYPRMRKTEVKHNYRSLALWNSQTTTSKTLETLNCLGDQPPLIAGI